MATSVLLLRKYVWLIETIRRAGRITLEEINRKWRANSSLSDGEEKIPLRTFHRHREAISDIFGVEILCDRCAGNVYYIEDEDIINRPSFTSELFYGLAIDNLMMENDEVKKRIIFEENPGGKEYLPVIIEALTKKLMVDLKYRSYNNPEQKEYSVEPYGLKQAGRRWYLVAHIPGFNDFTIFALDRIESIALSSQTFEYDKNRNLGEYFDEVIGVNLEEDYGCEDVKVRVYGHQRNYIESLPLHKSQKLLKREKDYSDYSFRLRAEYEFQHEILKMGFNAEVLSPQWLRDEMKWRAQEILTLYK